MRRAALRRPTDTGQHRQYPEARCQETAATVSLTA